MCKPLEMQIFPSLANWLEYAWDREEKCPRCESITWVILIKTPRKSISLNGFRCSHVRVSCVRLRVCCAHTQALGTHMLSLPARVKVKVMMSVCNCRRRRSLFVICVCTWKNEWGIHAWNTFWYISRAFRVLRLCAVVLDGKWDTINYDEWQNVFAHTANYTKFGTWILYEVCLHGWNE